MNPEFEEILNRLKGIEHDVKQNRNMLESIQRRARMAIIFSLLKWFIILGFTFGIFYYSKPYINKTFELYEQVNTLTGSATNEKKQVDTLMNGFKTLLGQ